MAVKSFCDRCDAMIGVMARNGGFDKIDNVVLFAYPPQYDRDMKHEDCKKLRDEWEKVPRFSICDNCKAVVLEVLKPIRKS